MSAPGIEREWQCTCGAWVSMAYGRHMHHKEQTTSQAVAEMIAARERGEDIDAATEVAIDHVWFNKAFLQRDKPL